MWPIGLFTLARFVCDNTSNIALQYRLPYLPWQLGSFLFLSCHPRWPRKVRKTRCHLRYRCCYHAKFRKCKHALSLDLSPLQSVWRARNSVLPKVQVFTTQDCHVRSSTTTKKSFITSIAEKVLALGSHSSSSSGCSLADWRLDKMEKEIRRKTRRSKIR